jgi:eukaryotic-like serine/threonine-protein kinase
MGEVYRAKDTRLGRSAAIKTLPPEFALDDDRRARFEREAKTLATLNHPHIAQIYGLEDVPGASGGPPTLALAMELVEGEDLAQRLTRGPVPLDDVWPLARQIAEGLEAAHEAGIVHRDLKPANIRVTPEGVVKVLDFGLAKPTEPVGASAMATHSPTLTSPALTTRGVVLGTASYMAPEQAKGRPVDRRVDIWAFGCVVYELLTGRRAFPGEDVPEILGAILKTEPNWSVLPAAIPGRVRAVLRRCLAKDRAERWQHVGDVRLALAEAVAEPATESQPAPAHRSSRVGWVVAALASAAAVGLGVMLMRPRPEPELPASVTRFSIPLADDQRFTNLGRHVLALSPNGRSLVFVANLRLYRRDLSSQDAEPIPGTETRIGILEPVFSPDGEWVAYYSNDENAIRRVRVDGTSGQSVCAVTMPFGMSWGSKGILVGQENTGIVRCAVDGSGSQVVAEVHAPKFAASPHEVPGSNHIAFSLAEGDSFDRWERGSIVLYDEETGDQRTLVASATDSTIVGRHLVYRSRAALFSVPLDEDGVSARSTPTALIEEMRGPTTPDVNPPTGQYAVTSSGTLAYIRGNAVAGTDQRRLAISDGKGTVTPLEMPPGPYTTPRVSPDGRFAAFATGTVPAAIWIHEIAGKNAPRRLTFEGDNRSPMWSADGAWVYFESRGERRGIARQRADGAAPAELVLPGLGVPEAALPDGSAVLFSEGGGRPYTLSALSTRDASVQRFDSIRSASSAVEAAVSPDGRWLAYRSTEGRQVRTFVEPFPPTGARFELPARVEAAHAVWLPSGRGLIYQDYGTWLHVDVTAGATMQIGTPRAIERGGVMLSTAFSRRNMDVIPGTDSFLVVVPADLTSVAPAGGDRQIDVILNWQALLRQGPDRR